MPAPPMSLAGVVELRQYTLRPGTRPTLVDLTMIDSDDVLLLRPTEPAHPPADPATARPPVGAADPSAEWVVTTVVEHRPDDAVAHWLATEVHAVLQDALETPVATWRTEQVLRSQLLRLQPTPRSQHPPAGRAPRS